MWSVCRGCHRAGGISGWMGAGRLEPSRGAFRRDESIGRAISNSDFYLNVYPKTALSLSRIGTPTRTCDVTGIPAQVFEADVDGQKYVQHRRVRAMNNRHTSNTAWYTPSAYVEARATMLCIDLDPAQALKPTTLMPSTWRKRMD